MPATSRVLVTAIAAASIVGCALFSDRFEISGMVRFTTLEGGCWYIQAQNGAKYLPASGMTQEFRQDRLQVRATLEPRHDLSSTCQFGEIVDVLSIERR